MGKLALLLVGAAAAAGLSSGVLTGRGALSGAAREASTEYGLVARSAAQAGIVRAEQQLVASFTSATIRGTFDGVPYTTSVDVSGSEALLTSRAVADAPGAGGSVPFQIRARIRRGGGTGTVPAFASYAIAVNGTLDLTGSSTIVGSGLSGVDATQQFITVHSNGRPAVGSSRALVEAFGTYTNGTPDSRTIGAFVPRSNPRNIAALTRADSVRIPRIVPAEVVAAHGGTPTVYTRVGSAYFAAQLIDVTLPGGTRDNPLVYYIRGKAQLSNVTVNGYAVFVGDDSFDLNRTVTGRPDAGLNESAIAFFTPTNVTLGGNTTVNASVFSTGGIGYGSNSSITGNIAVGGNYDNGGGAVVRYLPPAPMLYRTWGGGASAFQLVAYREQ